MKNLLKVELKEAKNYSEAERVIEEEKENINEIIEKEYSNLILKVESRASAENQKIKSIILANPPQESGHAYMSGMLPPLNLLSLATTLKYKLRDAIEIKILDGDLLEQKKLCKKVIDSSADVLGVSINFFNVEHSIDLLKQAKESGKTTIIGGYHVNSCAVELMKQIPEIDFAVIGEGENVLTHLAKESDIGSIPNLLYRKNGVIKNNCIKDLFSEETDKLIPAETLDIDSVLPPDFDLIDNLDCYQKNFEKAYHDFKMKAPLPIYTHKGCLWREKTGGCIFCSCPDKKTRVKNPEIIWEEIEKLNKKYGTNFVRDVGDDITANPEWLKELLKKRPNHLSNIGFFAYSRIEKIAKNMDVLNILTELNVKGLFLGFESGSSKSLKFLHKGETTEQNYRCLQNISQTPIRVFASFTLGAPEETEDDLAQTVAMAYDIHQTLGDKLQMMNLGILLPYPGTEAFKRLSGAYPNMKKEIKFNAEDIQRKWIESFCKYESSGIYEKLRLLCCKMNGLGKHSFSFFDEQNENSEDKKWIDEIIQKSEKYRRFGNSGSKIT